MYKQFKKHPLASSLAAAIIGTSTSFGTVQANDVISGLHQQISNNEDPAAVVDRNVDPLSFRTPAGETEVTVSGYVKADFIYDTEDDIGDTFGASSIPTTGEGGDGHFRAHARQSRLRIRSATELESGQTLKTHIEGDFFGVGANESFSNSSAFRLRHAYFNVGRWTIGQTWTNFMDFVAYPTTVDFFGPAGKSFARQAQIRYTLPNGLAFSIENPETDGNIQTDEDPIRIRESTGGPGRDQLPDFIAAWRGGPGGIGGNYEAAVVVRSLGVGGDFDVSEGGFGVNLAGGWDFGFGVVSASITTGSGIGRYIINGAGNGLFVDADGDAEVVDATGTAISYMHRWSSTASSLVALGAFQNDDDFPGNSIDSAQTLHVNYMWNPNEKMTYGVEVITGNHEDTAGNDGTATRLQFGAQLNF